MLIVITTIPSNVQHPHSRHPVHHYYHYHSYHHCSITRQCEVDDDECDATVVAVLGMAHLNGVKRLIESRANALQ